MRVPDQIHGHIVPFTIAAIVVCCIGVLAHVFWPPAPPASSASPTPAVIELRDETVVTSSR